MNRINKAILSNFICAILVILLIGCTDSINKDGANKGTSKMDKPGIDMSHEEADTSDPGLSSLLKPTNGFVISSIPVTTIGSSEVSPEIKALGSIAYDYRQVGVVSSRTAGRIEKLYVRYRYQKIDKGDKIMEIYSPEIMTVEENLIFLLKNDPGNASLINGSKERLQILGMSPGQVQSITKSLKPVNAITIFSNYSGHIHEAGNDNAAMNNAPAVMKDISAGTEPLSIKEGMYVQKGQGIFSIYDPSKAWVLLSIYTDNQDAIRIGNKVHLVCETSPDKDFNGKLDFIEPFYSKDSKTLSARVYFDNAILQLPIGSQVKATIKTNKQTISVLPASAVLSLGVDKIVFRKAGDGFKARKVITGATYNDQIQILSGLTIKDSVAVNAQFLMDSESFIKVNE